jgi:hypothetical protein
MIWQPEGEQINRFMVKTLDQVSIGYALTITTVVRQNQMPLSSL